MTLIWQILLFTLVIGPLVFVHELGHFLFAKLFSVGVVKFAIGFGPALFRVRKGETIYQIGAIPLGGFVRMVGDMPDAITGPQATDGAVRSDSVTEEAPYDPDAEDPVIQQMLADRNRWFIDKPAWQRSLIVFAGPLFNFLFAIILVSICAAYYGEERTVDEPLLGSVMEGSPAAKGGLLENDRVLQLDGKPIATWEQLAKGIHHGTGDAVAVKVLRGKSEVSLTVQPEKKELPKLDGTVDAVYLIGIGPSTYRVPVGALRSVELGVQWSVHEAQRQLLGLFGMIRGYISPKDLAGPLFILKIAKKQADKGFENLILFISILSVSLGVLNLLPIPVLDGGHLLFFLLEAILGPISIRKKEFAQQVGMVLLLLLMVFALGNDLTRNMEHTERGIQWNKSTGNTSTDGVQVPEGATGEASDDMLIDRAN